MKKNKVWIIGAGNMAKEYLKVLAKLEYDAIVVGRGEKNCLEISKEFNCEAIPNGIAVFLESKPPIPDYAIVCVSIEELSKTTLLLLDYGIKNVLLEKPGIAFPSEINRLAESAERNTAQVVLAYNRRYYASVLASESMILEDGGVSSFHFEFTEWAHVIKDYEFSDTILHNWFLGNSTHVVDTAFFLGGSPKELSAFHKGSLNWHPSSSAFCGAGVSKTGALFSYHADWEAPGRWVLEIMTKKRRLIFKPMESLQVQVLGSVAVNPVEIDNTLDVDYKPGLYLQTKAFLENNFSRFCTINEQSFMINNVYKKMAGYS